MHPIIFIISLVAAAIFIVALVHVSVLTLELPKRYRSDGNRKPDQDDAVQHEQKAMSAEFAALINAITKQGDASRAEEKREDDDKRKREWITIGLIALTLGALGWQVGEMVKVYDPIETQAKVASDTEARQLRSYVYSVITGFSPALVTSSQNIFSVKFANGGATPAYVTWYELNADYIAMPFSVERFTAKPAATSGGWPGAYLFKEHTASYNAAPLTLTDGQIESIRQGRGGIFFWGHIFYKDIFGCGHYTNFCMGYFSQRGASLGSYECFVHNGVDSPGLCEKE